MLTLINLDIEFCFKVMNPYQQIEKITDSKDL